MKYKTIYLRRGKDESLKRFHPWVFSGAIDRADEKLEEGDIVKVVDANSQFIALGHYQIGSIAVRVLSFEERDIDDSFWLERLQAALDVRRSIGVAGRQDNNT